MLLDLNLNSANVAKCSMHSSSFDHEKHVQDHTTKSKTLGVLQNLLHQQVHRVWWHWRHWLASCLCWEPALELSPELSASFVGLGGKVGQAALRLPRAVYVTISEVLLMHPTIAGAWPCTITALQWCSSMPSPPQALAPFFSFTLAFKKKLYHLCSNMLSNISKPRCTCKLCVTPGEDFLFLATGSLLVDLSPVVHTLVNTNNLI